MDVEFTDIQLPSQSAEIFERLSRGLFISKNQPGFQTQDLYGVLEHREEDFRYYFSLIGFYLEKGEGYYYFSREENKSQIEDKVEKLFRYLDGLELLYLLVPDLGPGSLINLTSLGERLESSKQLSRKALKLGVRASQDSPEDKFKAFLRSLEKESFVVALDDQQEEFLVLDAFDYLVTFFYKVDQNS